MRLLSAALLASRALSERCSSGDLRPRDPRSAPKLEDIEGLEEVKAVLSEALVAPARTAVEFGGLFWHSAAQSAVLLVGPEGLGELALVEASAAAAGASVLSLSAREAAMGSYCAPALAAARGGRAVVVVIEALESAPHASLTLGRCLQEAQDSDARVIAVASLHRAVRHVDSAHLVPFGYVVHTSPPGAAERKRFLQKLLTRISRQDPRWAAALREAEVGQLANLTADYTFAEIEFVVRRAFLRSTTAEGDERDPVAIHHFDQILGSMGPRALAAFQQGPSVAAVAEAPQAQVTEGDEEKNKNGKDSTDPLQDIFGWCNVWLPEGLQLPPVIWAIVAITVVSYVIFGPMYSPPGSRRKRRGGNGADDFFGGGAGADFLKQFGELGAEGALAASQMPMPPMPKMPSARAAPDPPSGSGGDLKSPSFQTQSSGSD